MKINGDNMENPVIMNHTKRQYQRKYYVSTISSITTLAYKITAA